MPDFRSRLQANFTQAKPKFGWIEGGIIKDNLKPLGLGNSRGANVNREYKLGNQPMNNITQRECQKQPHSITLSCRYTCVGGGRCKN